VVLRNDLMNALRTLNIFADTFQQVDIMIDPTTKNCSMIAENNDIGRTTAQVVGAITGTALETRCNGRYVQDCLSVITSDSIRMMFTSPNKPIVVRPVGGDDFLYLVMPMHRN
jgi:DNA polymerase-3 subunit beta